MSVEWHTSCRGLTALACLLVSTLALAKSSVEVDQPIRVVPDNLYHIKFVNQHRGWITGYHGTVLRTDDGGEHWTHIDLGTDELLRRGSFPSADVAWLVGHRGSILHTQDAGESWQLSHTEADIYLRDIAFQSADRGWAVGHEGTVLFTQTAGQHWQRQSIDDWTRRDLPRLSGVAILDSRRVVSVGEFGTVAYTTDAGASWRHKTVEGEPTLTAVAAHGDQFIAVGLDGAVVAGRVTADGLELNKLPLNIPTHLLDVRMTAKGVLVSGFGVVVHCASLTQCQVQDTTEAFPSNFLWLAGVDLASDGSVWAVGLNGHVGRAESVTSPMDLAFVVGGAGWNRHAVHGGAQ